MGGRDSARTRRLSSARLLGNPKGDVLNFEGVSKVAHDHGIPLVVDNTLATPFLCRPLEHGADIVVHSATKFIGGHGTSIGGVIVDGGTSTTRQRSLSRFHEPDPSYHGLIFAELPAPLFPARYVLKARLQYLRDMGRIDRSVQFVPVPPRSRDPQSAHGTSRRERQSVATGSKRAAT